MAIDVIAVAVVVVAVVVFVVGVFVVVVGVLDLDRAGFDDFDDEERARMRTQLRCMFGSRRADAPA